MAKDASELSTMRLTDKREFVPIGLTSEPQTVGSVAFRLAKISFQYGVFDLEVSADGKTFLKKDRSLFEPIQILTSESVHPYEVVLQGMSKDKAVGYLAKPTPQAERVCRSVSQDTTLMVPALNGIDSEIARIAAGPHGNLPTAQPMVSSRGVGSPTQWTIKNDTPYSLRVLVSGPTTQAVEVDAGSLKSIVLVPGSYKVAANVGSGTVLPYYGEQSFLSSTSYSSSFYLGSK